MENNLTGLFLFITFAGFAAMQDLCPFDGEWKYHSSTGTCMSLQGSARRYFQANVFCQNFIGGGRSHFPGHLVYIFDKETDDFVKDLMKKSNVPRALIGLHDPINVLAYRWGDTQKELGKDDYRGWATGQPIGNREGSVVITEAGWREQYYFLKGSFFVCQVDAVMPIPTISCPLSEVGQRSSKFTCVIQFPDSLVPSVLRFQRAGRDVNECTSQRCQVDDGYESSMEANTTWVSSVLHIKKVQRDHEGHWTCSVKFTNGQNITSEPRGLQVYAVPSTVDCHVSYLEDTMRVSCKTSRVYPQAVCQWRINRGPNSESTNESTNNIQENSDGMIFYKGECSASITAPVAGEYQFNVSVYPSAPGLDGTKPSRVKSASLNVVVEPPKYPPVLYTSSGVTPMTQLETTENQTVTINCQIQGGIPEVYTTVIKCYPQQQNESQGSVAFITITTTRDFLDQTCSCYGRHLTGSTSETFVKLVSPSLSSSDQQLITTVVPCILGLVVVVVVVAGVWLVLARRRRSAGVLKIDSVPAPITQIRVSIRKDEENIYEVPIDGRPEDKEHNMKVNENDMEEAVYLNPLTSAAFKTGEETHQDNVYGNVAATGKPEDKNGVRNQYEASNYDCLASTAGDLNEDGAYTMITVNILPATTPASQAVRSTDQSIYDTVN